MPARSPESIPRPKKRGVSVDETGHTLQGIANGLFGSKLPRTYLLNSLEPVNTGKEILLRFGRSKFVTVREQSVQNLRNAHGRILRLQYLDNRRSQRTCRRGGTAASPSDQGHLSTTSVMHNRS